MRTRTVVLIAATGVLMTTVGALLPQRPVTGPSALSLFLVLGGIALVIASLVGIPSQIAQSRGHPNTAAIGVCAIVGVFFFPLWLIALVWAFTATPAKG